LHQALPARDVID